MLRTGYRSSFGALRRPMPALHQDYFHPEAARLVRPSALSTIAATPPASPQTPLISTPARMIQEMHVLTPDRTTAYSGFRAVRWIAGRVPLLWPLYPLLFIPGMARLGQRLYLWIAKNRFHLLPCRDGVCTIPPKRK